MFGRILAEREGSDGVEVLMWPARQLIDRPNPLATSPDLHSYLIHLLTTADCFDAENCRHLNGKMAISKSTEHNCNSLVLFETKGKLSAQFVSWSYTSS